MYGFPPSVGAVGTAALLNVGKSFQNLLNSLATAGYNIGANSSDNVEVNGDVIMQAMKYLSNELVITRPVAVIQEEINRLVEGTKAPPLKVVLYDVTYAELKSWLGKKMAAVMENQWGELRSFTGFGSGKSPGVFKIIGTHILLARWIERYNNYSKWSFIIIGLQFGNIFLGVQPLLGIEGDPMRMLFERDLTPHPQYAAFYLWMKARHSYLDIQHIVIPLFVCLF